MITRIFRDIHNSKDITFDFPSKSYQGCMDCEIGGCDFWNENSEWIPMAGRLNCKECQGTGIVLIVDAGACITNEQKEMYKLYYEWSAYEAQYSGL